LVETLYGGRSDRKRLNSLCEVERGQTDLENDEIAVDRSRSFGSNEDFSGFEQVEEISIEGFTSIVVNATGLLTSW